jgi:hypothetical protein
MISRKLLAAAAGAIAVVAVGCESTQDKSAELEAEGGTLLKEETGVKIGEESTTVEMLSSELLESEGRVAVAVELRNTSNQILTNVPIIFEVKDAKGKTVFSNDTPGLDQTLTSMPVLQPGEEAVWVHDQVFPEGQPKSVDVTVGDTQEQPPASVPEVAVTEPKLRTDPVSGVEVTGTVSNESGEDLQFVYLYGVARKGDQVVAAGRGLIDRLRTSAKPTYHIFMIGAPEGAELSVTPAQTFNYEGP